MATVPQETKQVDTGIFSKAAQSCDMPSYLTGRHTPVSHLKTSNIEARQIGKKIINPANNAFSFEAPTTFLNEHSEFFQSSYQNPYIFGDKLDESEYQNNRNMKKKCFSFGGTQTFHIFNQHDHKSDKQNRDIFNMTKSRKHKVFDIVNNTEKEFSPPDLRGSEKQKFHDHYNTQMKDVGHFMLSKEIFSDFVERNDQMNVYGPIMQRKRWQNFRETKNFSLSEDAYRKKIEQLKRTGFIQRMANKFLSNKTKDLADCGSEALNSYTSGFPSKTKSEPQFMKSANTTARSKQKEYAQSLYQFRFNQGKENDQMTSYNNTDTAFYRRTFNSSINSSIKTAQSRKRTKNIGKIVPKDKQNPDVEKFLDKDTAYGNKNRNKIIREQMGQKLKDGIDKVNREYTTVYEQKQKQLAELKKPIHIPKDPLEQMSLIAMCGKLSAPQRKHVRSISDEYSLEQIEDFEHTNMRLRTIDSNKGNMFINSFKSFGKKDQQKKDNIE